MIHVWKVLIILLTTAHTDHYLRTLMILLNMNKNINDSHPTFLSDVCMQRNVSNCTFHVWLNWFITVMCYRRQLMMKLFSETSRVVLDDLSRNYYLCVSPKRNHIQSILVSSVLNGLRIIKERWLSKGIIIYTLPMTAVFFWNIQDSYEIQ